MATDLDKLSEAAAAQHVDFSLIFDHPTACAHDAWPAFVRSMRGRAYDRERLNDAWAWFRTGWDEEAAIDDAEDLEQLERERHERSMPPPLPNTGPIKLPAKTMSFRQLLVWMEAWAKEHEDGELDMPVVMRLADDDNDEWMVGGLAAVDVDMGCTESDALVLDGSTDVEDV